MHQLSSPKFNFKIFTAVIFTLTMFFATIHAASASEALVKKYQDLAEKSGFSFTYESLETISDNAFTLHDITLIRHGIEDPVKIKSLKLTGITELKGIGLSAENIALTGLAWDGRTDKGDEIVVSLRNASVDGFYLPDPSDVDAPLFAFEHYALALDNMFITLDGNRIIDVPSITSVFDGSLSEETFAGFLKVSQLKFYPENINDGGKVQAQLAAFGYDDLVMDINLDMDWDLNTGRMALKRYEFDLKDVGALDIQMVLGGYTQALAKKIRIISAEIQKLPVEERDKASMQVLQEMGTLTLETMKLSFRDQSITDKIINKQAEASGQPPENMKAILPIMLNGAMAKLEQPELTAKLVSAVEAFLAQPGTLAITATPTDPLTFTDIGGLAIALPNILIEKLNIEAEAR